MTILCRDDMPKLNDQCIVSYTHALLDFGLRVEDARDQFSFLKKHCLLITQPAQLHKPDFIPD